jgi:tripartite-type tricarboxylate transporter receptor subunit TctC
MAGKSNHLCKTIVLLGAVIALVVMASGCAQPTAVPTVAPTVAPKPAATTAPATPTVPPTVAPTKPPAPNWPTQDITFIVPFNPGGGFDLQARILAPFIEKNLPKKVNVIIKNAPGAGGKTGAVELAKSKPDGYTIGTVGMESVAFMRASGDLDLDPTTWTWLGQMSSDALMVAVPTAGKYKTVADMKGQDIRFGVTSEMLPSAVVMGQALGMKVRPILYNGSGEAILAAMRGDLDAVTFSWPTMWKGVNDSQGKLTALFVASKGRLDVAKDVPTLTELGVTLDATQSSVLATSRLVVAPPGLDKATRDILEDAIAKAMKDPEYLAQMTKGEQYPTYANAATVSANMSSAIKAYTAVMDLIKPFLQK